MSRTLACTVCLVFLGCGQLFGLDRVELHDARPIDTPEIDAPRVCTALSVTANAAHSCVILADRSVMCWGNNTQNEVGTTAGSTACEVNGTQYRCTPLPVAPGVSGSDALGMSDQASCAVVGSEVYCWGTNNPGHVGGPIGNMATPTLVAQRAGSLELSGGELHMCSLTGDGAVWCAGKNTHGEVGDGTTTAIVNPVKVLDGASAIGTGYQHSCAISGGTVFCWGRNDARQAAGSISSASEPTPMLVSGITGAVQVAGGSSHTCALRGTGVVTCWGGNLAGQLGQGNIDAYTAPVDVALADVQAISAGVNHTCAMTSTDVYCWGEGFNTAPTLVSLPSTPKTIASGSYHDCAVVADGTVYCWGWNAWGQLGNGEIADTNVPAAQVRLCP